MPNRKESQQLFSNHLLQRDKTWLEYAGCVAGIILVLAQIAEIERMSIPPCSASCREHKLPTRATHTSLTITAEVLNMLKMLLTMSLSNFKSFI
jgi:hypothetical protein